MTTDPIPPKKRRRLLRWGGVLLLVAMGFLAGTAARLSQAPIALPDWVLARLETRLNRDLTVFEAELDRLALGYDIDAQALRLVLRDTVARRDGEVWAELPVMRLGLDGPALLRGQVRPRTVSVEGLALDAIRAEDGRWSFELGDGSGQMPGTWPEVLAALDQGLNAPIMAELEAVRVAGLTLDVADAITGAGERIAVEALLLRTEEGADLSGRAQLEGLRTAVDASLVRDGQGARAVISTQGLRIGSLAAALPQVPVLSLARGEVGATARFTLDAAGAPGELEGEVTLANVRATDTPKLAADRMSLSVGWQPGQGRVDIRNLTASSDEAALKAEGQLIFEDGLVGPVQAQLHLTELRLDPEEMLDRAVQFEDGLFEARLTQSPLALHVGQAMLAGPSGLARAQARLRFPPEGVAGEVTLRIPQIEVGDLLPLWPKELFPGSRRWFQNNLLEGQARDVVAAVQLSPGDAPQLAASLDFHDGSFLFMRHMPPATRARGAIQFHQGRASIRADAGWVAVGDGAGIDIAGTQLVLPDALSRPPEGQLDLRARGAIGDVLELMDNRPFNLLQRLRKTRDLASGQAAAEVSVVLPLRPGNAPADISWEVSANLSGVRSDLIVPGRRIEANTLRLRADPSLVEIGGALRFDGVPFEGAWRQALPPPARGALDPVARPPEPRPLPEPGRVRGTASATPDGLARLGVKIDALSLSGRADVAVDLTLPQGQPPRLTARSDLRGMAASLPAIGWSKAAGVTGDLVVEATLGTAPQITRLALDSPGLEAEGRINLSGQTFEEARFDAVRTPWFRGPVTLSTRGAGRPPSVLVGGGRADLRAALGALSGTGNAGGQAAPVAIALDSLQINDTIALTGLRAQLEGASGRFTGGVNGGQQVSGVVGPRNGGTVVQVSTDDAGGVLQATGLFGDARGGEMTLTLQSPRGGGALQGTLRGSNVTIREAPALASLLQTLSVVGLLEQLAGQGLPFTSVQADFTLLDGDIRLARSSAVGPSMSITADGVYDAQSKRLDMQGVVSPIYFVNGLFGALFSRRDEGLFGFTYRLRGPAADPRVEVNPLSILTPGRFRDIFRAPPPSQ